MPIDARRTTIRAGREVDYERIHSAIPEPVRAALAGAGVQRWLIWRDGRRLFHTIETRDGMGAVLERMSSVGPLDPAWDDLIGTLVDDAPESQADLALVWGMDATRQWSSAE